MTLTYRIPEADLPPLPAVGHHDITVRGRNAAGEGEAATPVSVRTLETLRKRMIRVNGRWVRVDDLAFASALQGLSARTLEDESGVITLAEQITALRANISDVTATAIESLSTRVEMTEGRTEANAAQITSLVAEIAGAITAAAFMELTARVVSTENVDGSTTLAGLARWLVKTTVGDLVAGVGLYNDGMTSRFTVAADRFMILPPGAQDDEDGRIPFAVVNGKVFINNAVIEEASISVAKIENAFLTNLAAVHGTLQFARIAQGDIFDLMINNRLRSSNYELGTRGFNLSVGGNAEIFSPGFTPGADGTGWAIKADGTAVFNAASIRGKLTAVQIEAGVIPENFDDLEGQIGTADIAAGAIVADKIAANTILGDNIAANTIFGNQIRNSAGVIKAVTATYVYLGIPSTNRRLVFVGIDVTDSSLNIEVTYQYFSGVTCFPAGTPVLMVDGTWRAIELVKVGERVQGRTRINTVLAYDRIRLADHRTPYLFEINGEYQNTDDHLTLTKRGWAVLNRAGLGYIGKELSCVYDAQLNPSPMVFEGIDPTQITDYHVGDEIGYAQEDWRLIHSIRKIECKDQTIYSLVCDGDGTMQVAGGYVVSAWVSDDKWNSNNKVVTWKTLTFEQYFRAVEQNKHAGCPGPENYHRFPWGSPPRMAHWVGIMWIGGESSHYRDLSSRALWDDSYDWNPPQFANTEGDPRTSVTIDPKAGPKADLGGDCRLVGRLHPRPMGEGLYSSATRRLDCSKRSRGT